MIRVKKPARLQATAEALTRIMPMPGWSLFTP
jgi:hypothetical protein